MFAAAKAHGVHLVEAYPYLSQQQTLRLRTLLAERTIGQVQLATAAFGFGLLSPEGNPLGDAGNIRLNPVRGGGGLLDAGTYAMSMLRVAVGERPHRVFATGRYTAGNVDQTVVAIIEFPSGAIGQLSSTMSTAWHRHATIVGTTGVIETNYANHAPADGTLSLRIKRGVPGTVPFETEIMPGQDGFRAEGDSFARMIRHGPTYWKGATEAESIDTVMALEAIAESARSSAWVTLHA